MNRWVLASILLFLLWLFLAGAALFFKMPGWFLTDVAFAAFAGFAAFRNWGEP